ncbi:MAG: GNAT family N-acetyltransferase [Clostridia bacterium]|nr:GNAT family N-acetyltransferase [Clostridia bacterium]
MTDSNRKLRLHLPARDELDARARMLSDPATMSYNAAWGGTIAFPESAWDDWYAHWVLHHENRRYYRYVVNENDEVVGEIAFHFDSKWGGYMANVLIHSRYRHRGYGKEALELLCTAAKSRGIPVLYDDMAIDNPAYDMFLHAGFVEIARTDQLILLKKEL